MVRALASHPAIRRAGSGVEVAAAGRALARTGYLPRVDLTQDYVRSDNPVFSFGSKLGQSNFTAADFELESLNHPDPLTNSATRLRLRMSVWDAGRTRLQSMAAGLAVESAEMARHRTREQVAFNAVRAFWGAVLADEMLEVVRSGERAAGEGLALASSLVGEGMAVPSDRMQAAVRLSEVREMRISAERQSEIAAAVLREAMGASPGERFELDPGARKSAPPAGSAERLVSEALEARADLRAMDRELERGALGEKTARSTWLPEVGIGAQVEWNATDLFGNDGNNWTVGASLRVPLFEGMETGARLDRARAEVRGMEAARAQLVEGIRLEVLTALAEARGAEGRLAVATSSVFEAEESLRIVRERYAEGMTTAIELIDSEAALTRSKGRRAAALHDREIARAALDLAMGGGVDLEPGKEEIADATCAGGVLRQSPAPEMSRAAAGAALPHHEGEPHDGSSESGDTEERIGAAGCSLDAHTEDHAEESEPESTSDGMAKGDGK